MQNKLLFNLHVVEVRNIVIWAEISFTMRVEQFESPTAYID